MSITVYIFLLRNKNLTVSRAGIRIFRISQHNYNWNSYSTNSIQFIMTYYYRHHIYRPKNCCCLFIVGMTSLFVKQDFMVCKIAIAVSNFVAWRVQILLNEVSVLCHITDSLLVPYRSYLWFYCIVLVCTSSIRMPFEAYEILPWFEQCTH